MTDNSKQSVANSSKELLSIRDEWASRHGSQKGQYRLSHAKAGTLLSEIVRLEMEVDRLQMAVSALRPAAETSAAPLFPPTEPWPHSLGEQCLQYWGRIERRCQLTQGHEDACYFCVPAYAIRTDIPLDSPAVKATGEQS